MKSLPGAKGPNAQRSVTMTLGFFHRISLLVADAQASGEVARDLDPLRCASNVFALYFFALLHWIDGTATIEVALEPMLRDSLTLQLRGFRTPPA